MNTCEKKKKNLSWKKATLIPQPKLYFMAIWSCWFPYFFLSLQRLFNHTLIHKQKETKPIIEERTAFLTCHSSTRWYRFWGWIFPRTQRMSNEDSEDRFPGKCRRSQPAHSHFSGPAGALLKLLVFHDPSIALTHKALTPPIGHKNTSVIKLVLTGTELPQHSRW